MKCLVTIYILLFLTFETRAEARTIINIGLTNSPPPIVVNYEERKGLIFDLVKAMNSFQDQYQFKANAIPTKRMFVGYEQHYQDLVAFNDVNWGWKHLRAEGSLTLTNGSDHFFSLIHRQEDAPKMTAAVRGYHYAFADFDSDKLEKMTDITLVKDELHVMKMVSSNHSDQGIASKIFLSWYVKENPETTRTLRIKKEPDHTYHRQFIVLPESQISVSELNIILKSMEKQKILTKLFSDYGLEPPPLRVLH